MARTNILYFDFTTGASGDKILGALLEACEQLGLAQLHDLQMLAWAMVPGVSVTREKETRGGIMASQIKVTEEDAPHRNWLDIRRMIVAANEGGALSTSACHIALQVFMDIAKAEAEVHGQAIDEVHFHEVGAADSIVDVVGSCFLFDRLLPTAVFASPLVLGYGTFKAAHGEMSVPAPATALLIKDLPVLSGPFAGELTTPTGAALAAVLVSGWQPLPLIHMKAVGYGAGSRQLRGASNTVRLLVGESAGLVLAGTEPVALMQEGAVLIEANIDHRTPEALAFAAEELLGAGAFDVWQEPITMKKGRLAVKLSVLCAPDDAARLADFCLALTTSLGLRMRPVERMVLPRQQLTIDTPYGKVRVKAGRYVGEFTYEAEENDWLRPEHDDVARLAREQGIDYQTVYKDLQTRISKAWPTIS